MRVLILGYVWPEPGSSAAGRRTMDLIQLFLEQNWQIDFATSAGPSEFRVDLTALGLREHTVALNNDAFDAWIGELKPDLVVFDRFFTEEQFGWRVEKVCPEALRVIDTIDLHSLRETRARHQDLTEPSDLKKAMLGNEKTVREIAAIFRSDLSLMISDFELEFLQREFLIPAPLLHHCSFLIDKIPEKLAGFSERSDFVSIGSFRHPPNWDSVLWLKQEIWPKIREQLPQAHLKIYGSYPPAKAMELHNPAQGFHVLGWAPQALQVVASARVCLAPLRFGAGLKGKLLDAMLAGTPSVTTPVGAEGMHGALAWSGIIGKNVSELVAGAVQLYQQEPVWEKAQTQGSMILTDRFLKSVHGPRLIQRLLELSEQKVKHRQDNFVGAMLRHHMFQSTKHLSNWIQLKSQRP